MSEQGVLSERSSLWQAPGHPGQLRPCAQDAGAVRGGDVGWGYPQGARPQERNRPLTACRGNTVKESQSTIKRSDRGQARCSRGRPALFDDTTFVEWRSATTMVRSTGEGPERRGWDGASDFAGALGARWRRTAHPITAARSRSGPPKFSQRQTTDRSSERPD